MCFDRSNPFFVTDWLQRWTMGYTQEIDWQSFVMGYIARMPGICHPCRRARAISMSPAPRSLFRAILVSLTAVICLSSAARASYEVLEEFQRPGTQPLGRLLKLASGETYGTASDGGAFGFGSVFKITASGSVETLVSFTGTAGAAPGSGPTAGLVQGSDGALYGTTSAGGTNGFGVVFKIGAGGAYSILIHFTGTTGAAKGSVPGPLLAHPDGFLYGSTEAGGTQGAGTLFKLSVGGTFTTLATFTGATTGAKRGAEPVGQLATSGANLFGVTRRGGANNLGTVFKVTTSNAFTDLADFTGAAGTRPGANPAGGLMLHSNGKFYGTTEFGGTNGFGVLFSLTNVATPVFATIRSFADATGSQPAGELLATSGTTLLGCCAAGGANGLGGIYQITTGNVYSLVKSFDGETGSRAVRPTKHGITQEPDWTIPPSSRKTTVGVVRADPGHEHLPESETNPYKEKLCP